MKYLLLLYSVFLLLSCHEVSLKKKTIAIQPYGKVKQSIIDTLQHTIETVYNFETVLILENKKLPESAFIRVKSPRYRADSIISILKRKKPDSIDYLIGITSKDISTTKRDNNGKVLKPEFKYLDWGVFGLGYRPGPSCIVSTHRIKSSNKTKFIDRMKKVCMHEIGHNLGLPHCEVGEKCVMRDAAETIKTIDNVNLELCQNCKSLLE
jgi:archaemetzincin